MTDLRAFARELVADMERDLGTKLDWIGVDHYNNDNPHLHVLVRGKADDGRDLVISRDYISRGIRARAQERVTLELGPSLNTKYAQFSNVRWRLTAGPSSMRSSTRGG
jgi:type IV secretory pathway VirD2 relaxase